MEKSGSIKESAQSFHPSLEDDQLNSKKDTQSINKLNLKVSIDSEIWKCISARPTWNFQALQPNKCFDFLRPIVHRPSSTINLSSGLIHVYRSDNILYFFL